jgi:hypothetical protein
LTVTYTVSGTAAGGSDYSGFSGTLIIPAGASSATLVATPNDDTLVEGAETVIVTLAESPNYILGASNTAAITIADNDFPTVSINDVTVTEGNLGTVNAVFNVSLSAAISEPVTVSYSTANVTASAGTDYVGTSGLLTFNAGETSKPITVIINGDTLSEPNETFFVNLTTATNATIAKGQGVGTILDDDLTLVVSSFQPTPSGFDLQFNRAVDGSSLNLYGTETGNFGPPDVTLVGAATGPATGSLLIDAAAGLMTFVKTGGVLPPDSYTLTLRSAVDGFRDTDGNLLDGDGDGTAGGDYVTTFVMPSSDAVVVSLPDFAFGPGQVVNVPFDRLGLPIRLSGGTGVTSVELDLFYESALLTMSSVSLGDSLPTGTTLQADLTHVGVVSLRISAPTSFAAGAVEFARVTASVPIGAPYKTTQVLSMENVFLNGGMRAAVADDALHLAAYPGDTTGNRNYSALDGQRVLRVAAGLDSGFAAYLLVDPVVVADITGNGAISSLDATRILQEVVGLDRPEIPPLP